MPGFDEFVAALAAKKVRKELGQDGKPVGDYSYDIQWDGNTEGKVIIPLMDGVDFVKVSGKVLTKEELIGATYVNFDATTIVVAEKNIIDSSDVGATTQFYGVMADNMSDAPVIVSCKACTINFNGVPVTVPSDGTYFLHITMGDGMYVSSLSKETIVPIDRKYLPNKVVDFDALDITGVVLTLLNSGGGSFILSDVDGGEEISENMCKAIPLDGDYVAKLTVSGMGVMYVKPVYTLKDDFGFKVAHFDSYTENDNGLTKFYVRLYRSTSNGNYRSGKITVGFYQ